MLRNRRIISAILTSIILLYIGFLSYNNNNTTDSGKDSSTHPPEQTRFYIFNKDADNSVNRKKRILMRHNHEKGGAAIAILTPSPVDENDSNHDLAQLCQTLKSLELLKDKTPEKSSSTTNIPDHELEYHKRHPVLIFNEGNLYPEDLDFLVECARNRPIGFPTIKFDSFPPLFLKDLEEQNSDVSQEWNKLLQEYKKHNMDHSVIKSRNHELVFGRAQIIRFWTFGLWKHPAVMQFDTIMRIDSDSCFISRGNDLSSGGAYAFSHLPDLDQKQHVYQSIFENRNNVDNGQKLFYDGEFHVPSVPVIVTESSIKCSEENAPGSFFYIKGLYNFAVEYMGENQEEIPEPRSPVLWELCRYIWESSCDLPKFSNSFEVMRRVFFQSPEVMKWNRALSEEFPFGIYRNHWSDSYTRFLTLAIFAEPDQYLISSSEFLIEELGFAHDSEQGCLNYNIDDILERLGGSM